MSDIIETKAGHKIEVRQPTRREAMRLLRMWGKASEVQMWLGQAMLAACVRGLDGTPVMLPETPDKAEALVERLDDDGLLAIADWLENKPAPDPKAFQDAVKNS